MSQTELSVWEKAMAWRKRQMVKSQLESDIYVSPYQRNAVLEEVAQEFDKMTNGGDTTASFAIYVRSLKK